MSLLFIIFFFAVNAINADITGASTIRGGTLGLRGTLGNTKKVAPGSPVSVSGITPDQKTIIGGAQMESNNKEDIINEFYYGDQHNDNDGTYFIMSSSFVLFAGAVFILLLIWNLVLNIANWRLRRKVMEYEKEMI